MGWMLWGQGQQWRPGGGLDGYYGWAGGVHRERERERGRWWAAMVRVDVGALGGQKGRREDFLLFFFKKR